MLTPIFEFNTEDRLYTSLFGRESDIEVEDEELYDADDHHDGEPSREGTPDEENDVFREDEDNLSIAECF